MSLGTVRVPHLLDLPLVPGQGLGKDLDAGELLFLVHVCFIVAVAATEDRVKLPRDVKQRDLLPSGE